MQLPEKRIKADRKYKIGQAEFSKQAEANGRAPLRDELIFPVLFVIVFNRQRF